MKTLSDIQKEFDELFPNKIEHVKGAVHNPAKEKIKAFLSTVYEAGRSSMREEAVAKRNEEVLAECAEIRKRIRCGACDGAKCGHTQSCKAIYYILELLNK